MLRRIGFGLAVGLMSATSVFAQAAPAAQAAAAPAPRVFASGYGMVLNFIKPDKTADFEEVVGKLKEALQKSDKPGRKEQAKSWKVFKSPDPAAGGNVLYVFVIEDGAQGRRLHGVDDSVGGVSPGSAGALHEIRRRLRVGPELREPLDGVRPRQVVSSERQIQSCVDAVRWRVQRTASQLDHPIIDAQLQRPNQRNLRAAAGVEADASVRVQPQRLVVDAGAGGEVRLEPEKRTGVCSRTLPMPVLSSGAPAVTSEACRGVFELERDHHEPRAERRAQHASVRRCGVGAEKRRDIRARRSTPPAAATPPREPGDQPVSSRLLNAIIRRRLPEYKARRRLHEAAFLQPACDGASKRAQRRAAARPDAGAAREEPGPTRLGCRAAVRDPRADAPGR